MPKSPIYTISKQKAIKIIQESKTWKEIFQKIGISSGSFNNGRGWSNGKNSQIKIYI